MNEELDNIEISINQAKAQKDLKDAVLKLTKNREFKKIIEEGYFINEASRLVLLKADPALQDEKSQRELDNSIIGIGYLRRYLSTLIQLGYMAERSIKEDEATREELLNESIAE